VATKFENKFPQIQSRVDREMARLVQTTAVQIEAEIKKDMASTKHGQLYKRGKKTHVASAPGEAPAIDTGTLVNSIQSVEDVPFAAEIGTSIEYAPLLEDGTQQIQPRPAFKRAEKKFKNIFQRNANKIR
jgi:hypothetical protein